VYDSDTLVLCVLDSILFTIFRKERRSRQWGGGRQTAEMKIHKDASRAHLLEHAFISRSPTPIFTPLPAVLENLLSSAQCNLSSPQNKET